MRFYWRERNHEVDFTVRAGRRVTAIEVKSGRAPQAHAGTVAFVDAFKTQRTLLVGGDGIAVGEFLEREVMHWVGGKSCSRAGLESDPKSARALVQTSRSRSFNTEFTEDKE